MSGAIPPLPALTKAVESAEQTITLNTEITVAHGLGSVPALAEAVIRCKTAEHGFAIGDEYRMPVNTGAEGGLGLFANATNVVAVIHMSTFNVIRVTGNDSAGITLANWKLVLRAWL